MQTNEKISAPKTKVNSEGEHWRRNRKNCCEI